MVLVQLFMKIFFKKDTSNKIFKNRSTKGTVEYSINKI